MKTPRPGRGARTRTVTKPRTVSGTEAAESTKAAGLERSPRIARDRPKDLLEDGMHVRTFLLADWATVTPDMKMQVGGGGVSWVNLARGTTSLPQLFLAVRVYVPPRLHSDRVELALRALDETGGDIGAANLVQGWLEPAIPNPVGVGNETSFGFVVPLTNLPLPAGIENVYFELELGGRTLSVMPLAIRYVDPPQSEGVLSSS